MKRPLLKDVAGRAGVSVGLASRVLRNTGSFSEASRSRVLEAARDLGYTPDAVARSLKVRRSKAFGVLVSNIVTHFFALLVRGIEDAASKAGYAVILCNTDENQEKEQRYLAALYERNVDGLIICASPGNDAYVKKIARSGIPMVLAYRTIPGLEVPRITTDNAESSRRAVSYLIGLGHRDIAIVTGIQRVRSSEERLAGYRQALEDSGIPLRKELIVEGRYDRETSQRATRALLEMGRPPSAILASAEPMTMGVLGALKEAGRRIPSDLSVIGYGDPPWAALMTPPLTVVRHADYHMGLLAGETLMSLLEGPGPRERANEEIVLRSDLVIRQSCGRPGGRG